MSICSTGLSDHETDGIKPLAVTVATARKLTGLGATTLWARIKDRTLETVCIGRRRLILYRSLERMLSPGLLVTAAKTRRRGRPPKMLRTTK
jgi:hypothetical protein